MGRLLALLAALLAGSWIAFVAQQRGFRMEEAALPFQDLGTGA